MKVSVAYALRDRQIVRELELPDSATLATVLERSGLLQEFPEIELVSTSFGIYGRVMPLQSKLQPGDRVEIYRQLTEEPKRARRKRAGNR